MKAAENDGVVLAIKIAEGMMRSGGETYRAEECCLSVLKACGAVNISVVSFPTAMLVSAELDGVHRAESVSIKSRGVDLNGIAAYNSLSRRLSSGELDVESAFKELDSIKGGNPWLSVLYTAVAAGFFCFVFGGGAVDFLPTVIVTLIAQTVKLYADRLGNLNFISVMLSCIITAALARVAVALFPVFHQEAVIVGGIISMVPGLALTNSLRDTLSGDLISGAARMFDALITAVVIAAGVAMVLAI
ncbi:MAG: threonine/serine exporter family protein [Ruminococcaceae bacterium]|nr:threonine/serine exporter family protein [Oscillospiraceae bacterium]